MIKKLDKKILFIILTFVLLVLVSAYVIEYILGYQPCKLCIYERIPYFVSVLLILSLFFLKKNTKFILITLSLIFLGGAALSFYHFGIEQGFFEESIVCTNVDTKSTLTKEELLETLKNNTISCKEVNFRILGFSLATINIILSLILSAIFAKLFINYEKN
tara:strand:- start:3066 stop:3548 length:483 start_codon:yes stop_codon:yes gene_type:complete